MVDSIYVNKMFNISSNLLTYYKHMSLKSFNCHNFGNQYINCDINLQQTNDISYTNTHAYSINLIEQVFARINLKSKATFLRCVAFALPVFGNATRKRCVAL